MNNTFIVVDDTQFCVYLPLREFRRIDTYLVSLYPNYSRTSFSKMLERGCIMLNGEVLSRSCKVRCADVISLRLEAVNMQVDAQEIPLDIVFECSDFAIINKEAGMNVHPVPGAGGNSNTLVNALLYHFNGLSILGGVSRPGIVHRLDKDTSGLLIIAKNDRAMTLLQKRMLDHAIVKTYRALVVGIPKTSEGTIESFIGRDEYHRTKMTIHQPLNPKFAKTDFRLLESYQFQGVSYSLLELRLHTGRTHQIRVHCASLGIPIVGDILYGQDAINKTFASYFGLQRQFLHAYKLAFEFIGRDYEFIGPLKDDLLKVLERI